MAAAELVQLHLISPSHVEPPPDKTHFGRFDKVLRSVGSPRTVFVRPRMITIVAQTRFVTSSGLPVSLVGLHGKDELLVVGPPWALERLAAGRAPQAGTPDDTRTLYAEAMRTVLEEAFWLCRLEGLLALARGAAPYPGILSESRVVLSDAVASRFAADPAWARMTGDVARCEESARFLQFAAVEMLQGMFRCTVDAALQYFAAQDVTAFVGAALEECREKSLEFAARLDEVDDVHPHWWAEWEPTGVTPERMPDYLTRSGRNVVAYPTREQSLRDPVPRRYAMHARWDSTVKRHAQELETQGQPAPVPPTAPAPGS